MPKLAIGVSFLGSALLQSEPNAFAPV